MQQNLSITQKQNGDIVIFSVSGKLDFSATPLLENKIKEIISEKQNKIILDFSNLSYISSPGLRLLLETSKMAKNFSGKLIIFGLQNFPLEIIKDSNFDYVLEIAETEEAALNKFKS